MRKFIIVLSSIWLCLSAYAQSTVRGTVFDDSGAGTGGVLVAVEGSTTVYTMTDNQGHFEIPAAKGTVLEFSCMGLVSQKQTVQDVNAALTIYMETDSELLEETVVVGYGVTKKRDLAGSVSQIKTEDVKAGVITSTADLLRGRAAGVTVRQESFAPGAGITIRVRGASSISADNTPLYVVDGLQSSVGNQISPEDIESIEILKDAAATAI